MRNKARLRSPSSKSSTSRSGEGEPARQCSNSSFASESAEVFSNQQLQFFPGGLRDGLAIGYQGVGQRRSTLAFARGWHAGDTGGHNFARVVGILAQVREDIGNSHRVVLFVPAIVVGDH